MNVRNMKSNPDVWRAKEDIPLWKIGRKLGLSENTIIRWLREELEESRKQQIMMAIRDIKADNNIVVNVNIIVDNPPLDPPV